MLLPSGNPFICHEEVLYLQPLIPSKCLDIFSPLTGGCSEALGAFRFFFKYNNKHWYEVGMLIVSEADKRNITINRTFHGVPTAILVLARPDAA